MKKIFLLLISMVALVMPCQAAVSTYGIYDSIPYSIYKPLWSTYLDQHQKPYFLQPLPGSLLQVNNPVEVRLKFKKPSRYEIYGLQHLSRPDFVFVRFAVFK